MGVSWGDVAEDKLGGRVRRSNRVDQRVKLFRKDFQISSFCYVVGESVDNDGSWRGFSVGG